MNAEQHKAATSIRSWLIALAGPGAGKTHTEVERAKVLVDRGYSPADMCFVTFTSNGANVLRKRLEKEIGPVGFVGTIHKCMLGMLRRDDKRWTVISESDALEFMQRHAKLLGYKGSAEDLKLASQSEKAVGSAHPANRVVRSYRQFMRSEFLLDYDMVLVEGLKLMKTIPGLNRWPCWFWDEFQDSAPVEMDIIFAANPNQLFIAADPDQCCFQFRGARPENVTDLWNDIRFERHILDLNYRCAVSICTIANEVIQQNKNRIDKRTVAATDDAGEVTSFMYPSETDEAAGVSACVRGWIDAGIDPKQISVISPTNAIVDQLRDRLKADGLPVTDSETERKPRDWRLLTLILSMIASPNSWAVARLLTRELAKANKLDATQAEKHMDIARDRCPGKPPVELWAFPSTQAILSINADFSRFTISPASHKLMADRIRVYEPKSVDELLEAMRQTPETVHHRGVTVQTAHNAKGEEYRAVCVAGVDRFTAHDATEMAEKTRLLFVALTRAERLLNVTCSMSRTIRLPNQRTELVIGGPGKLFDVVHNHTLEAILSK